MKYQIFGPNGNKVCIVEALVCQASTECVQFWDSTDANAYPVFGIPGSWAAIPLEFIKNDVV